MTESDNDGQDQQAAQGADSGQEGQRSDLEVVRHEARAFREEVHRQLKILADVPPEALRVRVR